MNTRKTFARIVAGAAVVCFAGCMNIPAQLNNFSSEVNPLPFPTVQRVVKDAVATSHEPDSVGIISFSPDAKWYDVTLGYLCFTPIAALECGVALVKFMFYTYCRVGVWRCFGKRCAVSAIQPPGKHVSA